MMRLDSLCGKYGKIAKLYHRLKSRFGQSLSEFSLVVDHVGTYLLFLRWDRSMP